MAPGLKLFDRIALHNFLFSETAYELIGFTERKGFHGENRFAVILKQPFVQAERGANLEEVKTDMTLRGFRHLRGNDFYSSDMGLIVEDLHDENVLYSMNQLIDIDPVIYLETKDMQLDGQNLFQLF
jgi:hypothetical protein